LVVTVKEIQLKNGLYNIWCAQNGCIATAIIVSNSVQQNIIEKIFGNIKILNCKGKAFVWLRDNYDYITIIKLQ
jgi:hypothetical protein